MVDTVDKFITDSQEITKNTLGLFKDRFNNFSIEEQYEIFCQFAQSRYDSLKVDSKNIDYETIEKRNLVLRYG